MRSPRGGEAVSTRRLFSIRFVRMSFVALVVARGTLSVAAPATFAAEAKVTVGSPHDPFPRNKQNEPSVAELSLP